MKQKNLKLSFSISLLFILLSLFSNASEFANNNEAEHRFTENKGQIADFSGEKHPEILYYLQTKDLNLYFTKKGLKYYFYKNEEINTEPLLDESAVDKLNSENAPKPTRTYYSRVDFNFLNSNPEKIEIIPLNQSEAYSNYYLPNCPEGIHNVKRFESLKYKNVYEGIDLIFSIKNGSLKYDIVINPGADYHDIQFLYDGATGIDIISDKEILIKTPFKNFTETIPLSFYYDNKENVDCEFLVNNNTVSFNMPEYDKKRKLIIDPSLYWGTFLDYNTGSNKNNVRPVFDSNGNIYNAGRVQSLGFPLIDAGGGQYFDNTVAGTYEILIYKFNSSNALQWSTYYGSTMSDNMAWPGRALAMDDDDNLFVLMNIVGGGTGGGTFPTYNPGGGAFYQDQSKMYDWYNSAIIKLDENGVREWATVLSHESPNTDDQDYTVWGISSKDNKIYFTGISGQANTNKVPLRNLAGAYYDTDEIGSVCPFVGRFSNTGVLEWCTYFHSGNGANTTYNGQPIDVQMDSDDNLWVIGKTATTAGASVGHMILDPGGAYMQSSPMGSSDIIFTKFDSNLQPIWSSYYGGSSTDEVYSLTSDLQGKFCFVGYTYSSDFTTYNPGSGAYYKASTANNSNIINPYIVRLSGNNQIDWATTYTDNTYFYGVEAGSNDLIYVYGRAPDASFDTYSETGSYNDASFNGGTSDYVFLKFDNLGVRKWATFYGGDNDEGGGLSGRSGMNIYFDPCGTSSKLVTFGGSRSDDFPVQDPAGGALYQATQFSANTVTSPVIIQFNEITTSGTSTAPTSALASPNSICSGNSTTLSVNGGSLGIGASWEWYSGSCGGTSVGSGSSLIVSPTTTTIYYVQAVGTCNTTTCVSVTITVNTNSTAPTSASAAPTTICSGSSTTLSVNGGSLGTGASWEWYSGSCGGTSVGTGSSISVSPTSTTTYYVQADGTCNTTTCVSVTITVNSNSTAPTSASAAPTTICSGSSTTLSVNGGSLGTGASWEWYSVSCGGTSVGTGSSISVSPTSTTTYYVLADGTCNTTACVSITVTVNTNSTAPTSASAAPTTICSGNSTTLSVNGGSLGTGASWEWYSGSCGGTSVGTGSSISVSPTSTTTYYVQADGTCNTTACVSVTVTVNTNSTAPTSASATQTTICSGSSTTLSVNGGSLGTGASWEWYSGSCGGTFVGSGSSLIVSPTTTTTYYVLADGTCNTTTCQSVTITVNSSSTDPTSATATSSTICEGTSTDITVNGGSLGIGANWYWYEGGCGSGSSIGNGTTINVSPTSTTVYYVLAEGTCNNTACVSVVVNVIAAPNAGTDGNVSICDGDPSINLFTELGGTPTGGGVWTNSGGTVVTNMFDPSTTAGDVYTYTVTGTSPCNDATATVTVTVDPLPAVSFTNLDSVYCGDGSLIVLTGNQAPNGTFTGVDVIDNGDGTADYTYVTPGTHDITYSYTNGFGCTNTEIQTVVIQGLPSVAFVGLDTAYCQGEPIVNIIGNHAPNGTFTGTDITDNGNGSATYEPITVGIQIITYEYTDGNGCTASDEQTIEVFENPSVSNVIVTDVTVCSPPYNGEISVTASGGSGTYLYAIDGGILGANNIFSGLNVGAYIITIEDDLGCSIDSTITVNSNTGFNIDSVDITNIDCYGDSTGQLIVYATDGVQFSIDNGVTYFADSIFNNLPAGTYNVTAQDTGSCTDIYVVNITEAIEILISSNIVDVSCGGNNGSASLIVSGGTAPYYYLWSNDSTSSSINNLTEGTYYVTVTDDLGCSVIDSVIIGNSGGTLATSISNIVDIDCYGNSNGSATVEIAGTGPYTYLWSNGDTTSTITGLSGGYYYVTVEDLFGCQGIDTVYIQEPTQLTYSDTITDVSCYGNGDGIIDLNTSGGTPGYSYNWLPTDPSYIESGDTYSGLPPETYAVTVTDANGCSITIPKIDVGEPDAIEIQFSGNMPSCYGYLDGICNVNATGGTQPYTFLWSEGTQGTTISNLSTGEYYVTVTDDNSCVKIDTLTLPSPEQILYTENIIDASCIGNNDGEIILQIYNGSSPFTYAWNTEPVQTDSSATELIAGTYELTITDNDGCQIIQFFDVLDGTITCLEIPTIFTPNGDGTNDDWELKGIWIYDNINIEIYNRWGDLIFSHNGTGNNYDSNRWDGTYKGKELPISSYIYIINLNNETEPIQGIVTIKK